MPIRRSTPPARAALAGSLALGLSLAGAARAQGVSPEAFEEIKAELARQAQVIAAQQAEIDELRAQRDEILAAIRAGSAQAAAAPQRYAALQGTPNPVSEAPPVAPVRSAPPPGPVGQRPPEEPRQEVAAIPPGLGVLTPRGRFIFDPSLEYTRASNNRVVFRGVEVVPGINIGALEVSDADRDTGVATLAGRFGLTDRMEVEARVPYMVRRDLVTVVREREDTFTQREYLDGHSLGDVELAARYQLNYGRGGWPIFVANTRVRAPTGTGPYDVRFDEHAAALDLATGSGFWGVEAGVTMLYPTDPAIIFGGLTYLRNLERDVDKTIGTGDSQVHVESVQPGDSIGASLGFGLSLNPRFSVSFGYSHSYIFPTQTRFLKTEGNLPVRVTGESEPLQVGSLLMGWSFRLTERLTVNNSFEIGVTEDAPDLRVVIRTPYRF